MRSILILALLFFAGCRPAQEVRAPSSGVSRSQAIDDAAGWMLKSPGRSWRPVADTGSMVPTFDESSILLVESVSADQLQPGDLALYSWGETLVCHRVIEVREDGVFFSGDNNARSDGWVAPELIRERVAGILFTQR